MRISHDRSSSSRGKEPQVVDSIMVVGALTCCVLLYSVCDFENCMNMQRSQIREFMLYALEQDHNALKSKQKHLSYEN